MTEIRYIEKPEVFSQVSNRLKAVVITNDLKNAGFCQKILLDYYFDENLESLNKNSGIFSKLLNEELYELIILDISVENNENQRFLDVLRVFNDEIIDLNKENTSFYLLISPYLQGQNIEKVLNSHKTGINPNILKIIPKQTYEYLNGNLNKDLMETNENYKDLELVFGCFFEKGGGRKDTISSFELLDEDPIKAGRMAGNKVINSHIFLREITFRLGKLPKFGA
jgi:hypothetical protein